MRIPRYSLYGTPEQWSGNIQEDEGGQWVKWYDITPYLEYCEQQGFQPPEQLELPGTIDSIAMAEDRDDFGVVIVNEEDDHELPPDDGEDLYELMTRQPQKDE